MNHDPPRFLEHDSQVDPLLRDALRAGSAHTPSAAQLQALALKIGVATVATASAAAVTRTGWLSTKVIVKLSMGLLVAGTGTWLALSSVPTEHASKATAPVQTAPVQTAPGAAPAARAAPARAPAQRHAVEKSIAAETATAEPAQQAPSTTQAIDVLATPPPLAATSSRPSAHVLAKSHATPDADQRTRPTVTDTGQPRVTDVAPRPKAASELSLLGQAQLLIAHDPAGALELLEEHARLYPKGTFVEERKALSIDALRRLGRSQEMRQRASDFLKRYPTSVHRDVITKWLE